MHSTRTTSTSIINGVSKNKDQQRKSSLQHNNGKREIPRVQIFLDCHLSKAIQQIKTNTKPTLVKPINLIVNDKTTGLGCEQDQTMIQQKNKCRKSTEMMNCAQYSQVTNKWRQHIELMPNDVVLDYIKEVYQKYSINNPFEGYLDDNMVQKKANNINNLQLQSNQNQVIERRTMNNWHSFSQQKQQRHQGEQQQYNNDGNDYYQCRQLLERSKLTKHNDEDFATQKKIDSMLDFMNYNKKDIVRTQKKLSQNQQRILQLKNKFRLVESGGDNSNEQSSTIHANIIKHQQQQLPLATHQKQQSIGNMTYIDNLKNLMQSQLVDFSSSSRANGNSSSERNKLRSMKFINSMGDVMGVVGEGMVMKNQEGEDLTAEDITGEDNPQSVVRPKKKLFVKTIRGMSTKHNSIQDTPVAAESAKKTNNMYDESSLIAIDANNKQSTILPNKLFMSNRQLTINQQNLPFRTSLTSSLTTSSMQIPQFHRYCLGCEQSILDSNILYHEQNCSAWKKIAQLPVQQLLLIVDNKLAKIRSKLGESELFNLKIDDLNEIKALGRMVLNDDDNDVKQQKYKLNSKEQKPRDNVNKIDRLLQKKVLRGCQMIKKLQWFMKLKNTIKLQLESQLVKNNSHRSQQKKISAFTLLK